MTIKRYALITGLGMLSCTQAQAELTIFDTHNTKFEVGGSIRPEWIFRSGNSKSDYNEHMHDSGSRFRFTLTHELNNKTSVFGYSEMGIDIFKQSHLRSHYNENQKKTYTKKLFVGVKNDKYGALTYGKQWGVYYWVVGLKSDMWGNDGLTGPAGVGPSSNYAIGSSGWRTLLYANQWDRFKVVAAWYLPYNQRVGLDSDYKYKRKGGSGLGVDYKILDGLTLSGVYDHMRGSVVARNNLNHNKVYNQEVAGAAITWDKNDWYIVSTMTHYQNYAIHSRGNKTLGDYFTKNALGMEAFIGRTFNFEYDYLQSIQAYVAWDGLRERGQQKYKKSHFFPGATIALNNHVQVGVERTISHKDPDTPNSTWITMYLNF